MSIGNKPALYVAILTALGGLGTGHFYLRRLEQEMSGGPKVQVLSVLRDLPPGTTIKEGALGIREIPIAYLDERVVLARDREKVVGIDTVLPLRAQQSLEWSDLAVRTDIRNLSELVAAGKRGVTVRAGRGDTNGNKLIRPGDYVDVVATLPTENGARSSLVLLQKVLVIAVGMRTDQLSDANDKGASNSLRDDGVLTLSLEVEEAQLLALASEQGTLSVAVRNPEDTRTYEDLPDMSSSSLVQARDALRARKRSATGPTQPVRITAAP